MADDVIARRASASSIARSAACALAIALCALASGAAAQVPGPDGRPETGGEVGWDAQISSRLLLGGGAWIAEQGADPWPLFEVGLRADVLFGEARPGNVRFGPAIDLRTEDFRTLELGGGAAVFFPTGVGFGITTTFGAGWGARPEDRDGAFAFGQIAVGYRPYDYFSAYGLALNVYAGARVQLEPDPRAWEITIGVEVDLEILFVIPFMFLVELARASDPHEPMEPDAPE